jgi:hypothetical protein
MISRRDHLRSTALVLIVLVCSEGASGATFAWGSSLIPMALVLGDVEEDGGTDTSAVADLVEPSSNSDPAVEHKDLRKQRSQASKLTLWKHPSNLFENASFEAGRDPWSSLKSPYWTPFEVSEKLAHSGTKSARLTLDSNGDVERGVRICGVARDLQPNKFPEVLSGWYCVNQWSRGTQLQYVQVVIGATQAGDFPEIKNLPVQLAYVLTGVNKAPLEIENRRFAITGSKNPKIGEWIPFKFYLHDDFKWYWKKVPMRFGTVRVLFEVRFDKLQPGDTDVQAEVYFDDLYLGSDVD